MSRSMEALLERAGMTLDDLPKTWDECQDELALLGDEICDIKEQIAAHDNGIEVRPAAWRRQATRALNCRRSEFSAIKRYADRLEVEKKVENVAADLRRAIEVRDEKLRRVHVTHAREDVCFRAVRRWIKDNYPDRIDEVYALIDTTRAEYDERTSSAQEDAA